MLRIRVVYPGSWIRIFPSRLRDLGSKRFRVKKVPGPRSESVSKNWSIFKPKNMIRVFIPDPDHDFFTNPWSRSKKGTGYRIRIRNTTTGTTIYSSVTDPWHFGGGSGSADPCLWLMDPDPAIFVIDLQDASKKQIFWHNFFCLLLFEATFTSFSKDKKSKRVTKS